MDRGQAALQAIVGQLLPLLTAPLAVYARWEYRVSGVVPGPPVLVSGVPVSDACPFGELANITLWPGPDGGYATPAPGSLVLVEFHDGSPAKPAVCGLDPSTPPILTTLAGGQPGQGIVRLGDVVTITPAQVLAAAMTAAGPGAYPVTSTAPLMGTITSASAKAVSG